MTRFEELAKELNVVITVDENGFYTGLASALARITNDVILSEDEDLFEADWDEQKKIIKGNFLWRFPYMA